MTILFDAVELDKQYKREFGEEYSILDDENQDRIQKFIEPELEKYINFIKKIRYQAQFVLIGIFTPNNANHNRLEVESILYDGCCNDGMFCYRISPNEYYLTERDWKQNKLRYAEVNKRKLRIRYGDSLSGNSEERFIAFIDDDNSDVNEILECLRLLFANIYDYDDENDEENKDTLSRVFKHYKGCLDKIGVSIDDKFLADLNNLDGSKSSKETLVEDLGDYENYVWRACKHNAVDLEKMI